MLAHPSPSAGLPPGIEVRPEPPRLTPEALEKLFRAFSRTSREMERSHQALQARVEALTAELAEKDRRLEQKKRLEALGLVVAGVAHEFRNPLGSLSLYLDCLSEIVRGLPPAGAAEAAAIIGKLETGIRHLDAIVEDMLIFTRASGPLADRCDLPRLIDEALLLVRGDLEAAGALPSVEVDPGVGAREGGAVVDGDRGQTVRVFVNVLKNAAQAVAAARPPGDRRIRVTVRAAEERPGRSRADPAGRAAVEFVEVAVLDNGPGVSPDRMDKLFVPFHTEKAGGVGLGLTIVHSLMERQGGRVEVESPPGGGFLVRLLFAAGRGAGDPAAEADGRGAGARPPARARPRRSRARGSRDHGR